jgi:hypothetical protein
MRRNTSPVAAVRVGLGFEIAALLERVEVGLRAVVNARRAQFRAGCSPRPGTLIARLMTL